MQGPSGLVVAGIPVRSPAVTQRVPVGPGNLNQLPSWALASDSLQMELKQQSDPVQLVRLTIEALEAPDW